MKTFLHYLRSNIPVFLFSLAGGAIMPLFTCNGCMEDKRAYFLVSLFTFLIWSSMWLGNEALSHGLDKIIRWTERPILRLIAGIVGMLVYVVLVVFLLVWIFETFAGMYMGNVYYILYSTTGITTLITLVLTSRAFLFNWRQVAINAERLERESMEARYESLKNQVNPHFLFNSLNALTNLVHEDPDRAVKFIKQLSDVYRYVLDTRDRQVVPLAEEIRFLKSYIYLQEIRYGGKLSVQLALDDASGSVAPLSLQMLVENAIKHNVVSSENPLVIRVYKLGNEVVVENPVHRKTNSTEPSSGVGLSNISRRYQFLTDQPVRIDNREDTFIVGLPVLDTPLTEN